MHNTKIMGVLNITPDSFYDGCSKALLDVNHINKKITSFKNADIIDVGCESTRPGSKSISIKEELNRLRIIDKIKFGNKLLSIDSYKPAVIEYCLNKGFSIINDISGGGVNFENINLANKYSSKIIIMHMQGKPETMQNKPVYSNIIDELIVFFNERIKYALEIGMSIDDIIIDPGIGFGKTIKDNDDILINLKEFKSLKCKILIGASRKSFLSIKNDLPKDRLFQTIGVHALSAFNGADFLRVHDVDETYKMLKIIDRFKHYG